MVSIIGGKNKGPIHGRASWAFTRAPKQAREFAQMQIRDSGWTLTRKRKVAYFLMVYLIIKHLLSHEYGLFDRLIELGVFALIAYEIIVSGWRYRQERKRKKVLGGIRKVLFNLHSRGLRILWSAPRVYVVNDPQIVTAWENSVREWIRDTNKFLEQHSPVASASFLQEMATVAYYDHMSQQPQFWQAKLNEKLGYLYGIMEKVDIYF